MGPPFGRQNCPHWDEGRILKEWSNRSTRGTNGLTALMRCPKWGFPNEFFRNWVATKQSWSSVSKKNRLYKHLDCRHVLVLTVRHDQIRSTLHLPRSSHPWSLPGLGYSLKIHDVWCLGFFAIPKRRELFNVVLWHWVSHFKCLPMSYIIPCPCVDLVGSPASSVWTSENWNLNTLSIFPLSTNSWE